MCTFNFRADGADPEAATEASLSGQGRDPLPHGSKIRLTLQNSRTTAPAGTRSRRGVPVSSLLCADLRSLDRRASARARSAGSGDTHLDALAVSGWSNARRVACRNWRSRPSSPGVPYSGSPHTGWPIAFRWTRIWWVRPVSRRRRSSEVRSKRALEREVRARLARVGAADRHARAHARVAPDRGLDRPRARRRAALDERQVLAFDQPLGERRLQQPWASSRARHHEQARGVAIQPMDDSRPLGIAAGRASGQQLGERQPRGARAPGARPGRAPCR